MNANLDQEIAGSKSGSNWLAISIACLTGSFLLYVFSLTGADPDLWGHIKFGQDLWNSGRIIREDPYSYLTGGQRWINHEWLAELVYYLAFRYAGSPGLIALRAILGLLIMGVLWRHLCRRGLDASRASVLVVLATPLVMPYVTVRPQIFTFVAYLVVLISIRNAEAGRVRYLWVLPPLFVVWANMHGGFLAGLGILLLWLVARLGVAMVRDKFKGFSSSTNLTGFFVFVVCVLAVFVNPYGLDLLSFLLRTVTVGRPDIVEWYPISLKTPEGWGYVILLGVSLVGLHYSESRPHPAAVILFAFSALLPLIATRHAPLFALTVIVMVGKYIGSGWTKLLAGRVQARGVNQNRFLRYVFGAANFVLAFAVFGASIFNFECVVLSPRITNFPARVVSLLKNSGVRGNLAVHFDWGEYVLWHLGPGIKVSVDGRRETVYSETVRIENQNFMYVLNDWDALLDKHETDMALVSKRFPSFNIMKLKRDWLLLYEDPVAALFVRSGSPIVEKIRNTKVPKQIPYDGAGLCFP